MKYAQWNERNYIREEKEIWFYELDEKVAKNQWGYYLYSLKGDKNKEYHVLFPEIKKGGENHLLYVESGFEVPMAGEVTGIIIAKNGNTMWNTRFIPLNKSKRFVKALSDKKGYKTADEKIMISPFANYYRIYLCFNDSPVLGKLAGYIVEQGKKYILIEGDSSPFYIMDTGETEMKKGESYIVVGDKKINKRYD